MAPAAKRAQEKAEYERQRLEEEEIKKAMDEQNLIDQQNNPLNDYNDEKVKAIPVEELIKQGFNKKLKQISNTMSKTMLSENYQPVINLQTTIDLNA